MEISKELLNCVEHITHVLNCESCMRVINQHNAQKAGSSITEKKQASSRENGKLGGRPKKNGTQ